MTEMKAPAKFGLGASAQRIEDPTMNMSRQVVEGPGTPGVQDVIFAVAMINGKETGRLPVSNTVASGRSILPLSFK